MGGACNRWGGTCSQWEGFVTDGEGLLKLIAVVSFLSQTQNCNCRKKNSLYRILYCFLCFFFFFLNISTNKYIHLKNSLFISTL